jgi:hypothetical protein
MLQLKSKTLLSMLTVALLFGLFFTETANAADLFDRLQVIVGKAGIVKVLLIFVAFLIGIGGFIWGCIDMLKLSKPETRGEATWAGMGTKLVAGTLLIGLTSTSDIMSQTVFGSSTAQPSNTSMYIEQAAKPYFG